MSNDVGEDAQLRNTLLHFRLEHELGSKPERVKALLDSWLILSIWDKNENNRNVLRSSRSKAVFDAMVELDVVVAFVVESESILSKLLVIWDLNVLRLVPELDSKTALYFPKSSDDIIGQAFVIFVVNESPLSF